MFRFKFSSYRFLWFFTKEKKTTCHVRKSESAPAGTDSTPSAFMPDIPARFILDWIDLKSSSSYDIFFYTVQNNFLSASAFPYYLCRLFGGGTRRIFATMTLQAT